MTRLILQQAWPIVTRLIFQQLWRDTPHFATVVAPAHMVFRDVWSNLPHKSLSEKEINLARLREKDKKINRKNVYNSSCLTKNTYFEIGNFVLVKNYKRHSKFDPYFLPKKFSVIDISVNGYILFKKTPNDIKLFNGSLPLQLEQNIKRDCVSNNENFYWRNSFKFISRNKYPDNDEPLQQTNLNQTLLRRSTRLRRPNPKYFNYDFRT